MKIAVLLSGGVDSSVALHLLKNQGHDCVAFYLKVWLEDELAYLGNCPWQEDLNYAESVCAQLGVPLHVKSLQKEYHDRVVSYTLAEIRAGRTPSPDIFCNQMIKFGAFFDIIDNSFDKVATGHYAQVVQEGDQYVLKRAVDSFKDQTYFLSRLSQEQLARILFPLGGFKKSEVRKLAQSFDLPTKNRKDSQGICFLGNINFSDFIRHHQGTRTGDLIEYETGEKVGKHDGFWFFTIGQRKGIGLSGGPWYVVKKDADENKVFISRRYHDAHLVRDQVTMASVHWIAKKPTDQETLSVKLRHGEDFYQAKIVPQDDSRYTVYLDGQDQGIAPGQFVVLYDKDYCLGAGTICAGESSHARSKTQAPCGERSIL